MLFVWIDLLDALKSFARRPLRSFLSSLGIGIGVTALITMLSISEGAKHEAITKIRSLGTNTLRIEARHGNFGKRENRTNLSQGLLREDGTRIRSWLGDRGKVGIYAKKQSVLVRAGSNAVSATVLGVNGYWFQAEGVDASSGRLLTTGDVLRGSSFCVFGSALAKSLRMNPQSMQGVVQIGPAAAMVVGVLQPKGRLLTEGTGLSALDFDNTVFLPITAMPYLKITADRILIDGMVISLKKGLENNVVRIAEHIEEILLLEHREVSDFTVVAPFTLLREVRESQRLFSIIMGVIASLSLVVGGIGVMNVMLANIAEQTREIGLRMAVGASRRRIINLYLLNSVVLTVLGSLWGGVIGIVLALAVQTFAGWEVAFSALSLSIAPISAVVIGVVFGIHPALRAAALDPAEALRDV